MRKIPAVVETKIIKPEQIIYEVGDIVKCHDNSYLMKMEGQGGYHMVWTTNWAEGIFGRLVKIRLLNLRVPAMQFDMRPKLDWEDKPVYLDTMVMDVKSGDLFLTKLVFLTEA